MKSASAALVALLANSKQFIMADLYTFTLVGGSLLRYSAAPSAVSANGHTFVLGPKFERSRTKVVIGTQVDELEVRVYPESSDLIGDLPFTEAAWQGQLDGALLQLERAFMPTYGDTSPGTVVLFAGRISDIDCSRSGIELKCRSHLELLNIQMPRRLWQASCTHVFGGPMCGYDRTAGTNALGVSTGAGLVSMTATAGSTTTVINGAPSSTIPFALGTIRGKTGANAGYSRGIDGFISGATVSTKLAFLFSVSVGDQFDLLPGCDRTLTTCTNVFQNQGRFGGCPYIPTPETAV